MLTQQPKKKEPTVSRTYRISAVNIRLIEKAKQIEPEFNTSGVINQLLLEYFESNGVCDE